MCFNTLDFRRVVLRLFVNTLECRSVILRCVNTLEFRSVILRCVLDIVDFTSVILRYVFHMLNLRIVVLRCVVNILELSSVIFRRVFHMFHWTVIILYESFVRSVHFTCVFEGRFSKITFFFQPWNPGELTGTSPARNEYSFILKSEPYMLDACLGNDPGGGP